MIGNCHHLALLLTFLLALFSATVNAEKLEERDWIEVRTANFNVRSVLNEKDTFELARQLELFRAAVSIVTSSQRTPDPIPTAIYALGAEADFKQFGFEQAEFGIFKRGLRNNTILLRDVNSLQETTAILHKYVHFLVSNSDNLLHPKWFNEGFAEHLSAIKVRRDEFEIGFVTRHRKKIIREADWIPLQDILAATDYYDEWNDEQREMFYAETWALVHYLLNRLDRNTPFATDMQRYLQLLESGEEDISAFEQAFGVKTGRLNSEVKRHLKRGEFDSFAFKVESLLPVFEADVVKLSRQESALGLAQLALGSGQLAQAEYWFDIAASSENTQARAAAGLGDVRKFRDDYAAAQPHFEQAVALAPDDPYCQLDFAEYWHYRAIKTGDAAEREDFFTRARRHYIKASELDDFIPETYAMYGQTFLLQGNYTQAIALLEEAQRRLPSALDIRLILAEAYAAAGRKAEAATAVRSVLIWSHKDSVVLEHARDIVARLGSKAERRAASVKSNSRNGGGGS